MLQSSKVVAHPVGFEPTTPGFVDRCSNPAELRVLRGALLSGSHLGPSRKHIPPPDWYGYNSPMSENTPQETENNTEIPSATSRYETDEFAEKRFRGWRLIGVIMVVVVTLALIAFIVDWAVIGPLEGRVF